MGEVFGKIWGKTQPIFKLPVFELHRIEAKAGYRCSTHCHNHKWNGFYVESGEMVVGIFKKDYDLKDETVLKAGDFTTVKPGEYHYFFCPVNTVAFEVYYPEMLSEDITRKDVGRKSS